MAMGYAVLAAAGRGGGGGGRAEHWGTGALALRGLDRGVLRRHPRAPRPRGPHRGASAFLGSALAIKPILSLRDGHISALEKVRTSARAQSRLEELAVEAALKAGAGCDGVDIAVQHLDSLTRPRVLAERLRERAASAHEVRIVELGAVVGAHVGPGTIAVAVSPRLSGRGHDCVGGRAAPGARHGLGAPTTCSRWPGSSSRPSSWARSTPRRSSRGRWARTCSSPAREPGATNAGACPGVRWGVFVGDRRHPQGFPSPSCSWSRRWARCLPSSWGWRWSSVTSGPRSSGAREARVWRRRWGDPRGGAVVRPGDAVRLRVLLWRMRWVAGASISACLVLLLLGLGAWLGWIPAGTRNTGRGAWSWRSS